MNNAEKFKQMFGFYATEMWAKSEQEFLDWINAEYVQENSWIPCSERLPEEYAQYLVCYEDGECFVYWLEDADWARGVIEKEHIVAWMPLPEPYKGEES